MAGSGPHQTSLHHAESTNVHQQGEFHDLEREMNMDNQQEGIANTPHRWKRLSKKRSCNA